MKFFNQIHTFQQNLVTLNQNQYTTFITARSEDEYQKFCELFLFNYFILLNYFWTDAKWFLLLCL